MAAHQKKNYIIIVFVSFSLFICAQIKCTFSQKNVLLNQLFPIITGLHTCMHLFIVFFTVCITCTVHQNFFCSPCLSTSPWISYVMTSVEKLDSKLLNSLEWRGYCDISIRIQKEMFLRGYSLARTAGTFDCHHWKSHL